MCQKNNNIPAAFFFPLFSDEEKGLLVDVATLVLAENEVVRSSSHELQLDPGALKFAVSHFLSISLILEVSRGGNGGCRE